MLWHSEFTCSGCFFSCLQSGSFGAKNADVEICCTRGACAGGNSTGDACIGGISIIGACTESIFTTRTCAGRAWIGGASVGGTCAEVSCARGAGGISTVKSFGIHLQLS